MQKLFVQVSANDNTTNGLTLTGEAVVSNCMPIKAPKDEEQTILDNTLIFLPRLAVIQLGITPNIDDKGDKERTMWMGRIWELRALHAHRYKMRTAEKVAQLPPLSQSEKSELDKVLQDPVKRKILTRLAAHWKGQAFRYRNILKVLEDLRYSMLRGTVVFCHGSGGCNWDNTRVCRTMCGMGYVVIAPDGYAYPKGSAMAQIRYKTTQALRTEKDDVDYWANDLIYSSAASGDATYSTKAENVLKDPDAFRALYERCYQLRRGELHHVCARLPSFVMAQGFYLAGESEGAMTVTRFDDQRYGKQVLGRIIISFSIEYCYFTPTPQDGEIGGQLDVPTLNLIGTEDEYFGGKDSVAKIVSENKETGYGAKDITGHGFNTLVRQGVHNALVCVMDGAVHSPCPSHDNFLRLVFNTFFTASRRISLLPEKWKFCDLLSSLIEVQQSKDQTTPTAMHVVQIFVKKMEFPQTLTLAQSHIMSQSKVQMEVLKGIAAQEEASKAITQTSNLHPKPWP